MSSEFVAIEAGDCRVLTLGEFDNLLVILAAGLLLAALTLLTETLFVNGNVR